MEEGSARLAFDAPSSGAGTRVAALRDRPDLHLWLTRTLGHTKYATTPLRAHIGDGVEIHFRELDDALRFRSP